MKQAAESSSAIVSQEQVEKQEAFFEACAEGQIDTVEALLKDPNVNVNQPYEHDLHPSFYGSTPLVIACQKGHTEVVRLLLNKPDINVNRPGRDNQSPLGAACLSGRTEIVRLLLNKSGIDVNQPGEYGKSPLRMACQNGHTEVVQLLLLNNPGIDVNQPNTYGNSPLEAACYAGHAEVVRLLLNIPGIDVNLSSPLQAACLSGRTEIVRLLLNKSGIDVNQPDRYGHSPLGIACSRGHVEVAQLLLNIPGIDVNLSSPLYTACSRGHTEIVQLLLNIPGIDVNQPNAYGHSPLYIACDRGHAEIVRRLLNAGADMTQADANEVLGTLLSARINTLHSRRLSRNQKDAKLLELNKIAYLLCTLPKDNPVGRNWDINNVALAVMVHIGHLYYKEQTQNIQKKIITIYSGVFKTGESQNEKQEGKRREKSKDKKENEDKRVTVFTCEKPKEVLYAVLPPELWEIVFMHMMNDAALPTVNETPLRNFLEALDKIDRKKDAEATQTSTAGAQVTTVAALVANSTVATTTTTARGATAEDSGAGVSFSPNAANS